MFHVLGLVHCSCSSVTYQYKTDNEVAQKNRSRTVIRFFNIQNVSPTEIHQKIIKVNCPHVTSRKSLWLNRGCSENRTGNGRPTNKYVHRRSRCAAVLLTDGNDLKLGKRLYNPIFQTFFATHCSRKIKFLNKSIFIKKSTKTNVPGYFSKTRAKNVLEHLITGDDMRIRTACCKRGSTTRK